MVSSMDMPLQWDVTAKREKARWPKTLKFYSSLFLLALSISGCTTTTTSSSTAFPANMMSGQAEAPRGFFDRLTDQLTERECNVGRFTCPFGLGPAGEPCDCTGPGGVVRQGRTIK